MSAGVDLRTQATRARNAVFGAFAINGAMYAAFLSRVPDIRDSLGLSPSRLGVTLLALSIGAVVGLPVSGRLVVRFGGARTMVTAGVAMALGVVGAGLAVTVAHSVPALMVALAVVGVSTGIYDVSMNLQGAQVEHAVERAIMPWFHAAFSAGTVASALLGAAASYLDVPIAVHLSLVAMIYAVAAPWFLRAFLPDEVPSGTDGPAGSRREWTDLTTLLIGIVVLAAAFTEGTANDWLAVALVDGYGLPSWAGVLGFSVFLVAMTAGRIGGTALLDRHGRVAVLRVLFSCAVIGALLVVFGGPTLAFVGAAVWGVGASLGFPVGMSAAADDPARAAARMSVVSTIGYTAFIAGPPLLGFLGEHVGMLHALLAVGATALVALAILPAVREPRR